MGKGEIVSGGTDGFYSVKLLMNRKRAENTISNLSTEITRLTDIVIPQLVTEQSDAEAVLDDALTALDTAIAAYNAGEITKSELVAAIQVKNQAELEYGRATFRLKETQLKKDAYTKQVEYLESQAGDDPVIDAWCTDLTEDLAAEDIVGTIEIPNERIMPVMIRPGYDGRAVYDFRRDGQLQPIMSMTPAQALYSAMIFPGWQKWMPTYRIGTIAQRYISGNAFVFDVTLDDAQSSAQNLNVNASKYLYTIQAEYMETNSMAFEIGDRVVVEFEGQDYRRPKIIGFESNPRHCEVIFYLKVTRDDGKLVTDSEEFGASFQIINSDLETPDFVDADYDSDELSQTYGYWKVCGYWDPYKPIDPDGYWVQIGCIDSISTQYPYRYKESEQGEAEDRIHPGVYEAAIPYWVVTEDYTFTGELLLDEEQHHSITVKSSVPYRLHRKLDPASMGTRYYPSEGAYWMYGYFKIWERDWSYDENGNCCDLVNPNQWHYFMEHLCNYILAAIVDLKVNGEIIATSNAYLDTVPTNDEYLYYEPHLDPTSHSVAIENYTPEEEVLVCRGPGGGCTGAYEGSHTCYLVKTVYSTPWTIFEVEYDY